MIPMIPMIPMIFMFLHDSYDSACKIVFEALFFRRGSDSLQAPPNRGANHPLTRVRGVGCRVQGAGCRVRGTGCGVQGAGDGRVTLQEYGLYNLETMRIS